jgi:hypothetical protein
MATDTWIWGDPNGSETTLTTLSGKKGVFMPNYDAAISKLPDGSGALLTAVSMQPRALDLPVQIVATNFDTLRTAVRALAKSLHARNGDGYIKVTRSGVTRKLTCRYKGGLEQATYWSPTTLEAVLSFEAVDPLWYASAATSTDYAVQVGAASFFPFFPLTVKASAVFNISTVTNPGDETAWPIWTITGPGTNPSILNNTTGERMSLTVSLGAGEALSIDTRPGYKTIMSGTGANLFATLSATERALWALAVGDNVIEIQMSDATGASNVNLTYTPRYMGA